MSAEGETSGAMYKVAETFLSFQGEGEHCGRAAFFIRLFGCNVRCPWCDTSYAWSEAAKFETLSAAELAQRAAQSGAGIAIITGGEPLLQDLRALLKALHSKKIAAHLETSGTLEICEPSPEESFDWVALSPKLFFEPKPSALARADEIKAIVSSQREISQYEQKFFGGAKRAKSIWINPEWSQSANADLLGAIAQYVSSSKTPRARAGWQLHKNYFAR